MRTWTAIVAAVVAAVVFFVGILFVGTVDIPPGDVVAALTGRECLSAVKLIVVELRIPMACTALLAGASLAVAGLLLQTVFDNPLAGPSILGVSTGASLGVAVVMLAFGGVLGSGVGYYAGVLSGAMVGAVLIMVLLLCFSIIVKSNAMLLIVGILIGYLSSSAISLLNFFSTQEGVHSYVIWGLGNFTGVTIGRLAVFSCVSVVALAGSAMFVKPLNALLLGSRYASSMGVNLRATRNWLLVLSGVLTAVVTAFCGPIGFVGLVVPHIARMACGTSNHVVLLPATMAYGAAVGLLCGFLSVALGGGQVIPVNAITPVISVPIIIYVIINRRKLNYFK